ncbi:hypothetical protein BT63DRAFT_418579 [Microthyrium microscopicum]|uniref:Uncharacterized protein n=1 Tax=Microthyrium microscopicum TaxID=703497 RepID=A0A6A6TUC2_9PEZI|nr:hypothetical protein BT63DRAFT_418579 [Microthyrium microscopicum]
MAPFFTKSTIAKSEGPPVKPNKIYFIGGHWGFTQQIKIYDITSTINDEYDPKNTDWFKKTWGIANKSKSPLESMILVNRDRWYGNNFTFNESNGAKIAEWKGGWHSNSDNQIMFPAESAICSHAITMEVDSYFKFRDSFVVDSVKFVWLATNAVSMRAFELRKIIAGEQTEVARFWQPLGQFKQGGILIVNTEEVDPIIAILTNLVVLRKQRLKYYEYGSKTGL